MGTTPQADNRATARTATTLALSPMGEAALGYAKRGWPVFPCEPRGKKPLCPHGLKEATTDRQVIREWWGRWPDANISMPTGRYVVLDVDGEAGAASLAELAKRHGPLPPTLTVKTGRGLHHYFTPNGAHIRNSAGLVGPHLDIRGEGGYVLVPPSIHENGNRYEKLTQAKVADFPAWIAALLAQPERQEPTGECSPVKIPKGQRNATLASLAGTMRRRGMGQAAIEAALLKENLDRGDPPLCDGEVRAIVASVSRYEPAERGAQPSGEVVSSAKLRTFSSISPEPLRWLWPGRIPSGKLTVVAGDPGLGKSLLTIDLAARVSTGAAFPDGAACEQGNVVLLSAEDDECDTIRPRLDAAGADVSRIHLLEAVRNVTADGKTVETMFNLERDLVALEDAILQTGARLIVVDPISAYMGSTDTHNNSAVRGLLSPLTSLAKKHKVTIVAVTHLRKSAGAAIHRIIESLAFGATGRATWGVMLDPDDKARRLFAPIKQNLAPDTGGLAYRVEAPNGMARIAWESGEVAVDVNAAMGGFESHEATSERREAEGWLKDFLADGPRGAADVRNQVRIVGLTWITVRRAADCIGIVKRKVGGRGAGWEWALPVESKDDHLKGAHPRDTGMSIFEHPAENNGDNGQSKVKGAHASNTELLWPVSTLKTGADEAKTAPIPAKGGTEWEA